MTNVPMTPDHPPTVTEAGEPGAPAVGPLRRALLDPADENSAE